MGDSVVEVAASDEIQRLHDVFGADRTVAYLAVVALSAGWLFLAATSPTGAAVRRTRLALWVVWTLGFVTTLAGLGLQGASAQQGGFAAAVDGDVVADALQTYPGRAWAACAMLFVVALPLLTALRGATAEVAHTIWWRVGALVVAAGLVRMSWLVRSSSGTARSAPDGLADFAVHVAVVLALLGGLALVAVALRRVSARPGGVPERALRLVALALPVALLVPPAGASPRPRVTAVPAAEERAVGQEQPDADPTGASPEGIVVEVATPGRTPPAGTGDGAGGDSPVVDRLAAGGIPEVAWRAYRSAEQTAAVSDPGCGIGWPLLAAIGRVESNHGRYGGAQLRADGYGTRPIRGIPLDGRPGVATIRDSDGGALDGDTIYDRAVGPMQFIPSSWRAVAADGNGDGVASPDNIYDAAVGASTYLCAGDGDLRTREGRSAAVYRYNHSDQYVATVLALADAYESGRTGTPPSPGPVTPVPQSLPSVPPGSATGDSPPAYPGDPDTDPAPSSPADGGGSGTAPPPGTGSPSTTAPTTTSTAPNVLTAVEDLLGL